MPIQVEIVYPFAYPDRKVYTDFVISLFRILDPLQYALAKEIDGVDIDIRQSQCMRYPIDANRNEHVRDILKIRQPMPDYLLFLDADMVHPYNVLLKLLSFALLYDKQVVGGLYHYGGRPFYPVALVDSGKDDQKYWNVQLYDDTPFAVDATGMGCLLVRADVFAQIKFPWFAYEIDKDTDLRSISEDMHFCKQLRKAGIEIWIEPTVKCGHIKTVMVGQQDYDPFANYLGKLEGSALAEYQEKVGGPIIDMRGAKGG